MILIEREPTLPASVETVKAQVLLTLRANHALQEFDSIGDLVPFLDQLLTEIQGVGAPRGLTRVVLFYRNGAALEAVRQRMLTGGSLQAFRCPACWPIFAPKLPELRAWAERLEPGWTTTPKGI